MFSKSCEYGIKAVVYIAQQSLQKKRVSLKAIAQEIGSPTAFTAKILQLLAKEKIVYSSMGKAGGYEMGLDNLDKITLLEIVNIIDGEEVYTGCGIGLKVCNETNPCPIHTDFMKVKDSLKTMLNSTTFLSLATNLNEGLSQLKIK